MLGDRRECYQGPEPAPSNPNTYEEACGSCISLQIANINFVLVNRSIVDSGKHSSGQAEVHNEQDEVA